MRKDVQIDSGFATLEDGRFKAIVKVTIGEALKEFFSPETFDTSKEAEAFAQNYAEELLEVVREAAQMNDMDILVKTEMIH